MMSSLCPTDTLFPAAAHRDGDRQYTVGRTRRTRRDEDEEEDEEEDEKEDEEEDEDEEDEDEEGRRGTRRDERRRSQDNTSAKVWIVTFRGGQARLVTCAAKPRSTSRLRQPAGHSAVRGPPTGPQFGRRWVWSCRASWRRHPRACGNPHQRDDAALPHLPACHLFDRACGNPAHLWQPSGSSSSVATVRLSISSCGRSRSAGSFARRQSSAKDIVAPRTPSQVMTPAPSTTRATTHKTG